MPDDLVPIMRVGADLLVTLQGDLDDRAVESIEREVTNQVTRTNAQGVLVDVSGLAVVDSFVARVLARLAGMVRLLGADTTLVGISPAVAITLTELGASLDHVPTALTAEQGMALLHRRRAKNQSATRAATDRSAAYPSATTADRAANRTLVRHDSSH
jgi:rsbT antagonist protein RsbS